MSNTSKIEWTGSTWNPITGCDKVSPGCDHCYADRMAKRLKAMGVKKYKRGFKVTLHPTVLNDPFKWKKPRLVFVNSMSDIFHDEVPLDYIESLFDVMRNCPQHIFQVLTKRSKRLKRVAPKLVWPVNVWMGVTVESHAYQYRIRDLVSTEATVKFLSLEPLLGPLDNLDLDGVDWAVVGGESGPNSRPVEESWILDIKRQCRTFKTAFFFKQWGGRNKKAAGRDLRGKIYNEMPRLVDPSARATLSGLL